MMTDANVEGNSSFKDGQQIVWDTISTGALKTCPRYYQLTIREGWWPIGDNPHITFGILAHSALEAYDRACAAGSDHNTALHRAVRVVLEKSGSYQDCSECLGCGMLMPFIEHIEDDMPDCPRCDKKMFRNHRNKWVPWLTDDKNKNRRNLLRTVVWYLDNYSEMEEEIVLMEDGSPAVEVWFRLELPITAPSGDRYMLTGHIDKIVRYAGKLWFRDLKTSKSTLSSSFFDKYSPDNQMSHYTLGCKVTLDEPIAGGIIDAAQVAVNFTAFQRGFVDRTKGQMEEWLRDIQQWIKLAEHYAEQGYWPMNDTACHHYGGCRFRGICDKDPSIRDKFLATHFQRKKWDPLVERGED